MHCISRLYLVKLFEFYLHRLLQLRGSLRRVLQESPPLTPLPKVSSALR